jgi:hypothetical protein
MAAEIRNYKYLLFPFIFHALIYETSGWIELHRARAPEDGGK